MARVKRGNVARKRRNKILRLARGFKGSNGSLFRTANQRVMKALCNAYRDRRRRKRDFRRLWIARINAAARIAGLVFLFIGSNTILYLLILCFFNSFTIFCHFSKMLNVLTLLSIQMVLWGVLCHIMLFYHICASRIHPFLQ